MPALLWVRPGGWLALPVHHAGPRGDLCQRGPCSSSHSVSQRPPVRCRGGESGCWDRVWGAQKACSFGSGGHGEGGLDLPGEQAPLRAVPAAPEHPHGAEGVQPAPARHLAHIYGGLVLGSIPGPAPAARSTPSPRCDAQRCHGPWATAWLWLETTTSHLCGPQCGLRDTGRQSGDQLRS